MAILRAFILLYDSCCTTSAIKLMAQSNSAAFTGGSKSRTCVYSSSVLQHLSCSGVSVSRTPKGSSLSHAYRHPEYIDYLRG